MSAPISANARSSVEINDSCNDCSGCFRKKKHKPIPRRDASSDLSVVVAQTDKKIADLLQPQPSQTPIKYGNMPPIDSK